MGELQTLPTNKKQQTGTGIQRRGAKALSEALMTNTTLQSLDLRSEQEESVDDGRISDIVNPQHQQTGNGIKTEGARALSEALKANTALQSLNLEGEQEERDK